MTGKTHPGMIAFAVTVLLLGGLGAYLYFDQQPDNPNPEGKPLVVYCAASLQKPITEIAEAYEREFGQRIDLKFDSSESLLTSIEASKIGDLFLSADDWYIDKGKEKGLIRESIPLARQQAVVLVAQGNPLGIRTFDDLLRPDVRLTQGNPSTAIRRQTEVLCPRGAELAEHTDAEQGTVILVANSVRMKSADAGIIWDTVAHGYSDLDVVRIPELALVVGEARVGVVVHSDIPTAALRFARYLTAPGKGLAHFQDNGFPNAIPGDDWAEVPELILYGGSMLRPAIEKTVKEFEQREGVRITTKFDGCGMLVAAMEAGDRPDMYFSCDLTFMRKVQDSTHNLELFGTDTVISGNQLMIAVQKGNPHNIQELKDLGQSGLRLGIGHEEKCAMGFITAETLRQAFTNQNSLYGRIQKNVVMTAPTGDHLISHMQSGALDAAIVYRSNLLFSEEILDSIPVTGFACAIPSQPVAIGKDTNYPHLMDRLMDALTSPTSRERFESSGFTWQLDGTSDE